MNSINLKLMTRFVLLLSRIIHFKGAYRLILFYSFILLRGLVSREETDSASITEYVLSSSHKINNKRQRIPFEQLTYSRCHKIATGQIALYMSRAQLRSENGLVRHTWCMLACHLTLVVRHMLPANRDWVFLKFSDPRVMCFLITCEEYSPEISHMKCQVDIRQSVSLDFSAICSSLRGARGCPPAVTSYLSFQKTTCMQDDDGRRESRTVACAMNV